MNFLPPVLDAVDPPVVIDAVMHAVEFIGDDDGGCHGGTNISAHRYSHGSWRSPHMLIETEMNCSDICWTTPVKVTLGFGNQISIDGPQSALNAMTQRWPATRGERYERARNLCMAALGRRVAAASIRDDFVAACTEAGVLAD
jgi:hypothetical protein